MRHIGGLILLLALVSPAWANFHDGKAAYDRGDYETALLEWHPLAERGHGQAQFYLGVFYDHGWGVPRSYDEALKWYHKAAARGVAAAKTAIGTMYAEGDGVPRDYGQAVKWLGEAAEQGHNVAQLKLAGMHLLGLGTPKDRVTALKWLILAARGGSTTAIRYRDRTAGRMQPAKVAEARHLARVWLQARGEAE